MNEAAKLPRHPEKGGKKGSLAKTDFSMEEIHTIIGAKRFHC
jgi:hypothetical protein